MPWLLLCMALFATDIGAKYLIYSHMSLGDSIPVLKNVFHLTYVRNTGAAFSIFEGNNIALSAVTALLLCAVIAYLVVKRPESPALRTALVMITAGGLGNLLDRLRFGYVVDFFDFRLINFAVFNTADVFVVCGAFMLAAYLFFFDKNEEQKDGEESVDS